MQQNGQLNYGVVTSLPKSNSLNETILFPATTRIQTASILTEFDENPDLKHAVGQPKRWELCWGFSVKVQTATNTLITLFSLISLTRSLQSAFYPRSAFYPWSAVCSLRFTLTSYLGGFWQQRLIIRNAIAPVAVSNGSQI